MSVGHPKAVARAAASLGCRPEEVEAACWVLPKGGVLKSVLLGGVASGMAGAVGGAIVANAWQGGSTFKRDRSTGLPKQMLIILTPDTLYILAMVRTGKPYVPYLQAPKGSYRIGDIQFKGGAIRFEVVLPECPPITVEAKGLRQNPPAIQAFADSSSGSAE